MSPLRVVGYDASHPPLRCLADVDYFAGELYNGHVRVIGRGGCWRGVSIYCDLGDPDPRFFWAVPDQRLLAVGEAQQSRHPLGYPLLDIFGLLERL